MAASREMKKTALYKYIIFMLIMQFEDKTAFFSNNNYFLYLSVHE